MRREFVYLFVVAVSLAARAGETVPVPKDLRAPLQPASGPGSSAYKHKEIKRSSFGEGSAQYWIFEPADNAPATAPVILFIHGWAAMDPATYQLWIRHLVRRGNIVIYPRYQATMTTLPQEFTDNAAKAIVEALAGMAAREKCKPDLDKVAMVGHSYGGVIAANLASRAQAAKLPKIKAVMSVEPGSGLFWTYDDYSKIPKETLLLCVAGDADMVTGSFAAKKIYREATAISADDKDFILCRTEKRGELSISADHFAPLAMFEKSVDAMDWYGFWKWFDALADAAFTGTNRKYALGNTPEQRDMGKWSDGAAVREPLITDEP